MWKYQKQQRNNGAGIRTPTTVKAVSAKNWDNCLIDGGFVPIARNPEVVTAVNLIAGLIASTSIHLYESTANGNKRVENGLSRLIDIAPNNYQTRFTFISSVVRSLLLEGDGNAVIYPETKNGLIVQLHLLDPWAVSYVPDGNTFSYKIVYMGKQYEPNELCHVPLNPKPSEPWKGTGYRVPLRKVVDCLEQANDTKAAFMKSEWLPTIIFSYDYLGVGADEEETPDGKQDILDRYVKSRKKGEPWLVPNDFKMETVKPLSLNDLALNPMIQLDKKTVASLLNIPPFILGIGDFKESEWNNFISTKVRMICTAIEQALTKSLLVSPNLFYKFNFRSLYSYDIGMLSQVASLQRQMGTISGNEARALLGFSPVDGLDDYAMLENYIPVDKLGDQKKLEQDTTPETSGGGEKDD